MFVNQLLMSFTVQKKHCQNVDKSLNQCLIMFLLDFHSENLYMFKHILNVQFH